MGGRDAQPGSAPSPGEKIFAFRGYLWGVRVKAVNALNRENPDTVVDNIDAPNFRAFTGGQGRAVTLRVRFIDCK